MEIVGQKSRVQRTRLQLLDSAAPQFESLLESREQYIKSLEETVENLKRTQVQSSENNHAIRNSIRELMAMQQLSNAIGTALEPEAIVGTLIHLTRQVVPVAGSNVFLFDKNGKTLEPLSEKSSSAFNAEAQKQVEAGIIDWVIAEQRTVILPDLESTRADGAAFISIVVPLMIRNEAVGIFFIRSPKAPKDLSNHDILLLTLLANQAAVGIENWRSYNKLAALNNELKASQAQTMHAAKLAAIGELSSNIVHEIKNPVQILMLHMDLVKRGKPYPNWTELLLQQVQRLSDITRRLMNFSRSTGEASEFVDVSVNTAIEETVAIVHNEYRNSNITINLDLTNDLPPVVGNHNCLQQVFLNLLINARDAMPQGGNICITTESSGFHVIIRFSDSGTGIDTQHLDKIFVPFFTTKGEDSGTGLGLPICRKIIAEHKGEIKVESMPNQGATFTVFLPIKRSSS